MDELESRVLVESTLEEAAHIKDAYFVQMERDTKVFEASVEESTHAEDAHLSGPKQLWAEIHGTMSMRSKEELCLFCFG
jgi:hypothetical protein